MDYSPNNFPTPPVPLPHTDLPSSKYTDAALQFIRRVRNTSYAEEVQKLQTVKLQYGLLREVRNISFRYLLWLHSMIAHYKPRLHTAQSLAFQTSKWQAFTTNTPARSSVIPANAMDINTDITRNRNMQAQCKQARIDHLAIDDAAVKRDEANQGQSSFASL